MIYATEQQVVVTVVMVVTVALVALFTGIVWGHRRGMAEAAEEEQWAREPTEARRVHPVYRQVTEAAHETLLAHEDQALAVANETRGFISANDGTQIEWNPPAHRPWLPPDETVLEPTAVLAPGEETTTAWTARMAADMDAFLRGLIGGTDEQLREITR